MAEAVGGLAGRGHAARLAPATSAQVANAWARAVRYADADRRLRGRWKRLAIGSWMERNCCTWRADLKRFICRSRLRVGWWEFSARLFSPLCWRCSLPSFNSRLAAP